MAWTLALGLQGGLWAGLWQASQSGGPGASPSAALPSIRTVVPVRWVAPPPARVAGTVAAAQPRGGAVGRSTRWVEGVPPVDAPQAVSDARPVTGAAGSGAGAAEGVVPRLPATPAEAVAPLDLRVPRAALRTPADHGAAWAAQDDRAHSAPLTRWDRLAQASGAAPCFVMRRDADGQLRKQVGRLVGRPRLYAEATGDTRPVFQCEAG
ncbi:hypothetical protein [Roseateles sp. BYS87W]|uniref:Uncharacterized protein n=1 Tax=Pelomonas baiyunensis TaxID=3299026 RepID=A0ABW7GZ44_9BURK